MLPLYALALSKNPLIRSGTEVRADERAALMALACRMGVVASAAFVYPRLLPVHDLAPTAGVADEHGHYTLPASLPLSQEKLDSAGLFLLDNSVSLLLWVGRAAPPELLHDALGVSSLEGVDCSRLRVQPLPNELSTRLNNVINAVRAQRPHVAQAVRVVAPKDSLETRFLSGLVEDRAQASMSYVEFLCHIHRQIQGKFN